MSEAYQTKENKEWERTRLLVSMIHNVNCTKRAQMIKPKDVIELPIDKIKRKKDRLLSMSHLLYLKNDQNLQEIQEIRKLS